MAAFEVKTIVPLTMFGLDISITNSSLYMMLVVAVICVIFWLGTANRDLIPTRLQLSLEKLFFFVGDIVKMNIKRSGVQVFPYVISLFLFIVIGNVVGLIPYAFSFTSQIIVTLSMASLVFLASVAIGLKRSGIRYFRHFCPSGVPGYLAPILVLIEIMSFLFRPVSLGIRLFANMLAGHIMINVMAGFAMTLAGASMAASLAAVPVAVNVLLDIFKLIVCMLQAYVFVVLTCMYWAESLEEQAH
ncbi:MAG: F0F1 ATP synthase subunit A [Holosporales bacterium]|nr:F0F1 ATP synthase subunit A [Holosporales bacterium]